MSTVLSNHVETFQVTARKAGPQFVVRVERQREDVGPSPATWRAIGQALALQSAPDSSTPADLCIRLTDALPARPTDATRLRQDARGTVWQHASGWRVERDSCAAHIDRDVPHATLAVDSAASGQLQVQPQALWAHAFRDVLTLLLPRTGWMPLHAAAVGPPDPETDSQHTNSQHAVLLVGPSGCGKSTLTTGLLLRGWRCISDDMLVLSPHTDMAPARVHSLAQNIHVCLDAWERLALNTPTEAASNSLFGQFTERAKRPLTRQALPDNERFAAHPIAHRAPHALPRCILLPTITDAPTSRLTPAPPADALTALMEQGVPPALLPASAARAQWQQMGHLIRQCATYRLRAGRDLYHDPGHLATLLRASAGIFT